MERTCDLGDLKQSFRASVVEDAAGMSLSEGTATDVAPRACIREVAYAAAPLYVCVHVPEFPAQARLRLRPEGARAPVAILDGDPPFEAVCSTNRKALALGVHRGMTRTELSHFPGMTILRRSLEEEAAARAALLSAAAAFTPRIEVYCAGQAEASSFVFVLDMSGTERIFGRPDQMVRRVEQALRALRLRCRLAVSGNFHVAVCVAAFAQKATWILRGLERAALDGLPLTALGLTEDQRDTFALWGLHTVGELAQLPEVDVVVRLGQEGRRLRTLARGEHPHLMVPQEPAFALEEHLQFDFPVENLESLLFVLGPMLEQLVTRAEGHALAIASLTLTFALDGAKDFMHVLRPALPSNDKDSLLKVLHLDLQANPPGAGVLGIHVKAEPGKRSKVQTGLFSPPLPEPMRLDVLLARLRAVVGDGRVGKARLLDTHRSEAFTMERFAVPSTAATQAAGAQAAGAKAAMRRFRPPVALCVQMSASEPCSFFYESTRYTVAEAYGPWRRSGDWWTEEVWSCEEWDVCATAPGGGSLLAVLCHDLLARRWQMDALYD